jgi:hypothetical protein
MTDSTMQLGERRKDPFGEYEERWMVEPPAEGVSYRVLEESWSGDYTVRTIWRFALSEESTPPTPGGAHAR